MKFVDTQIPLLVLARVAGVLQEMEAIQKREAEETAALENMIQQVEANLQTTTVRHKYHSQSLTFVTILLILNFWDIK